jgi:hypothetical protein
VRAEGVQRCAESQGHDELGSQLPPEQLGNLAGLFLLDRLRAATPSARHVRPTATA